MHALAALDLLYSLAPDGAPRPKDPEVLRALAEYTPATAPALATPRWFAAACAVHGIPASENGFAYETPSLAQVRAQLPETYGSGAQHTERAYVQGVLPAEELLTLLPARRLLLPPHDWRRLAFAAAWRAALARLLRAELGADPDAWLRLAATVTASEAASEGLTWAELLERAQSGAAPAASGGTSLGRTRPGSPDEAIELLEHGDHLWAWPEGTLLCLADAEVVAAVLPRLGPTGPGCSPRICCATTAHRAPSSTGCSRTATTRRCASWPPSPAGWNAAARWSAWSTSTTPRSTSPCCGTGHPGPSCTGSCPGPGRSPGGGPWAPGCWTTGAPGAPHGRPAV
ncbi:hypothetical protein L1856_07085 [Streptomyces sp. Tue 6430]|nr:hypothetical protein [Streptomyces sp. Tue 6430]